MTYQVRAFLESIHGTGRARPVLAQQHDSAPEAVQDALAGCDEQARCTYGFKAFYRKADRIKRGVGWLPWWDRPEVCPAGHVDPDWYICRDVRGRVRRCAECERERGRERRRHEREHG